MRVPLPACLAITTGSEIARSGPSFLAFGVLGFLWWRVGVPWASRFLRMPAFSKDRASSGLGSLFYIAIVAVGVAVTVVGLACWAGGVTFQ